MILSGQAIPARSLPGLLATYRYWPLFLLAFLAFYTPTYLDLLQAAKGEQLQIQVVVILLLTLFQVWRQRAVLQAETDGRSASTRPRVGSIILAFGVLLYAFGRTREILPLEVLSQIPVLLGTLLIGLGMRSVRALGFAFCFLLFLTPLPDFAVEAITGPLKYQVALSVEQILYFFGYPVARSGVSLFVGPYQLLVADACSGHYMMISLMLIGLFYLCLKPPASVVRNGILIASILPIAFIVNLLRVLILVMLTFHFGEDAGQGLAHNLIGLLLFGLAVTLLFVLDVALGRLFLSMSFFHKHDVTY